MESTEQCRCVYYFTGSAAVVMPACHCMWKSTVLSLNDVFDYNQVFIKLPAAKYLRIFSKLENTVLPCILISLFMPCYLKSE